MLSIKRLGSVGEKLQMSRPVHLSFVLWFATLSLIFLETRPTLRTNSFFESVSSQISFPLR